ncbi:MAG: hypothetical protein IJT03_03490 [Clostridia bacterium]|nr:hypothetical protein [Clostridia bacterium]
MPEDNDIKIYVRKNSGENGDFEALSEDIRRNKTNGNIEKAEALGVKMAQVTPEDKSLGLSSHTSASLLYQMRVLMTFTAEYKLRELIKSEFLSDSAVNAMYDYLKLNERGYYDNISDGGAFTFYLLALKKSGSASENIGARFADLCSTGSDEIKKIGADVFEISSELFSRMISAADFAE